MAKSKEELIELLRQNIKAFNSYRKETNYDQLDLSKADLSVANLCRADLTNCNLTDADLGYSYLHSAILKSCNMKELSFGRADMTEADLSESDLSGADLNNTILYGANLSGIKGKFIILEGAKVREANFTSANLENGNLSNLDLNGVNFDKANLKGAKLISSNLSNSINLQNAIFDDSTIWPDSSGLPSGFDPSNIIVAAPPAEEEDTSELNVDFGPGISSKTQEFEFLDTQPEKVDEEEEEDFVDFDNAITQLESPFERKKNLDQPQEFDELPNFEQFSANQFEDFPADDHAEPGLAMTDSSLEDLGDELPSLHSSEFDDFNKNFDSSLKEIAQSGNGNTISSSITQQEFTVQPTSLASNMIPNPDLVSGLQTHERMLQPSAPQVAAHHVVPPPNVPPVYAMPAETLQPIMNMLQGISARLETLEYKQKEQREIIETIKNKIDAKQDISPDILNKLNQTPNQEILIKKIDEVSAYTKNQFSRMESKMDIVAQTDPLAQIDTLLGEFTDYVQEENDNLGNKVNELITITESVVTLLENTSEIAPEVDLGQVTSELHVMLTNLESNLKEDQEKTDQKIETAVTNLEYSFKENQDRIEQKVEDMATNLDGFSVILEAIQSEVVSINESKPDNELSTPGKEYTQNISEIHEAINKLLELKDDGTLESQVFEALYDFEFRLKLELEKNESKLETLEETFQQAVEKIDATLKATKDKDDTQKITATLDEFKTKLLSEMKTLGDKSIELRAVGEDIVYQIKSSLNNDMSSIKGHLTSITEKIDDMASTPYAINEIKQSLEYLVGRDVNTENSLISINELQSNLRKELKGMIDYMPHLTTSNNNLGNRINYINKVIVELDKKFEQFKNEPKIDDELRSIFEHLLTQVDEYARVSKENTEKLSRKLDSRENELNLTIKELDRRVSKINSMIRNIYKGLDSLIDLVTGNSSPSFRSLSSVQDRSRRDFMPRSKDYEDDIDLD